MFENFSVKFAITESLSEEKNFRCSDECVQTRQWSSGAICVNKIDALLK